MAATGTPCTFEPNGRTCPNLAIVVVTLPASTAWNLPADDAPTCATCLPDWRDEVQATARPLEPVSA